MTTYFFIINLQTLIISGLAIASPFTRLTEFSETQTESLMSEFESSDLNKINLSQNN